MNLFTSRSMFVLKVIYIFLYRTMYKMLNHKGATRIDTTYMKFVTFIIYVDMEIKR